MDPYYTICQENDDGLEESYSRSPHNVFNIVVHFSYGSSKYTQSLIFGRDLILSEEHGPSLLLSMFPETAVASSLDLVRAVVVPAIWSFAKGSDKDPHNRGCKVIKLTVEVDHHYEASSVNIDGEAIDASLSYVNFKPASRAGIQALERVRYKSSWIWKECSICMEEFCSGQEMALMPCEHVYYHSCIVRWLETSYYCPLCRYQMPC